MKKALLVIMALALALYPWEEQIKVNKIILDKKETTFDSESFASVVNTYYDLGFGKEEILIEIRNNNNNLAEVSAKEIPLVELTPAVIAPVFEQYPNVWTIPKEVSEPAAKTVYLTFDDGPSPVTLEILDVLDEYKIKGAFFVTHQTVGQKSEEGLSILNEIVDRGHTIGVHTYSHVFKEIYASKDAFMQDFEKIFNVIYDQTGVRPTIYRYAGGSLNSYNRKITESISDELKMRGFEYYDWNSATDDSMGAKTAEIQAENAIRNFKENSHTIVLMHDLNPNSLTPEALRIIIEYGIENGYTFLQLDETVAPIQMGKG